MLIVKFSLGLHQHSVMAAANPLVAKLWWGKVTPASLLIWGGHRRSVQNKTMSRASQGVEIGRAAGDGLIQYIYLPAPVGGGPRQSSDLKLSFLQVEN